MDKNADFIHINVLLKNFVTFYEIVEEAYFFVFLLFVSPELCSERDLVITWHVSVRHAELLVSNIPAKPYEL